MTPFDRKVRSQVYRLLAGGAIEVDAGSIAISRGWEIGEVEAALDRLGQAHRLVLVDGTHKIQMAHPFSGVETGYTAVIGERSWNANCAWDALAVLSLLGDGEAHGDGLVWKIDDGAVSPSGVIHFLVPAKDFWDDIGFT